VVVLGPIVAVISTDTITDIVGCNAVPSPSLLVRPINSNVVLLDLVLARPTMAVPGLIVDVTSTEDITSMEDGTITEVVGCNAVL
jgi:hypothetical protein